MEWGEVVAQLVGSIPDFLRERKKETSNHPTLRGINSETVNKILVDFLSFSVRNPPVVFSQSALRQRENLAETVVEDNRRGWGHSIHPFEVVYLGDKKTDRWKDSPPSERESMAIEAHNNECGCGWPDHDFVFDVKSWIDKIFVDKMYDPGVVEMLSHFCYRESMLNNLDAALKVSEFIESQHRDSINAEPISRIVEILKEIALRKKNGTLNSYMFSNPSSWSFCDECGKGIPPERMDRSRCGNCAAKGEVA